jgi:hypothetical protein
MKGIENFDNVNFSQLANKLGKSKYNLKRTIIQNLTKINEWLSLVGLRISIEKIENEESKEFINITRD